MTKIFYGIKKVKVKLLLMDHMKIVRLYIVVCYKNIDVAGGGAAAYGVDYLFAT